MAELLPRVKALTALARSYDIGLNIDAEEADRLEISLDLLEALCFAPELDGWNGIGFVIQAYQKRAPFVIDYVIDLARRSRHRVMVRLVKGAYWDSEIKRAQVDGLEGYPVYTRKIYTDVAYRLAPASCWARPRPCIRSSPRTTPTRCRPSISWPARTTTPVSMGEPLVGPLAQGKLNRPCRIYAPVGTHETLLAYLVRRLLENGANTSFVNLIGDESIPVEQLVSDPVDAASRVVPLGAPHEDPAAARTLRQPAGRRARQLRRPGPEQRASPGMTWRAGPMLGEGAQAWDAARAVEVRNPANLRDLVGHVVEANAEEAEAALRIAANAAPIWQSTPVAERAQCLRRAAQLLEEQMQTLLGLIVREAGKSLPNAIAEVREAVDFLRYYADQASREFGNDTHRPLGTVLCISPWNFPLAIFTGRSPPRWRPAIPCWPSPPSRRR